MAQGTVWMHDEKGERQISGEGYAAAPQLSADGKTLYYLQENRGAHSLPDRVAIGEGPSRKLIRTNLDSGTSEAILSDVPIWQFSVSRDGKRVVYAAIEKEVRHIWTASTERRSPPRQISSGNDDMPYLLDNGDIMFRSEEGGNYFVYCMKGDGSGKEKVFPSPVIRLFNVSPDGQWIVVWMPVPDENTASAVEGYRLSDRKLVRLCDLCGIGWSADRKYVYFLGTGFGTNKLKSVSGIYALPLKAGQMLPDLPAGGIKSEAELKALGAVDLPNTDFDDMSPGPSLRIFAFSRRSIQRNLYRIPLP
jgi:Tol biopolymer transport system component